MKPFLEKVTPNIDCSFNAKIDVLKYIDTPWHYHPELEITYVIKSTGRRIVGDNVENFAPEDMVLSGPNLPHVWINDKKYYQNNSKLNAEVFVLHFEKQCFGSDFFHIPEASSIEKLLTKSTRGLKIKKPLKTEIAKKLFKLKASVGFDRILILFKILNQISLSSDYEFLASETFWQKYPITTDATMSKIIQYITQHFTEPIELEKISSIAGMTKNSFCRYFKKRTNKTFSKFLNEIRISYARKLLQKNNISVTTAAFECGYNNLSHFNRQFKSITGQTPSSFQKNINNINFSFKML